MRTWILVTALCVAGPMGAGAAVDCEPWTEIGVLPEGSYTALEFGGGLWVAVGRDGAITTSSDGVAWAVPDPLPTTADLRAVAVGDDRFIAVGDGVILTGSAAADVWTVTVTDPTYDLEGVVHGDPPSGAAWIAVGANGLTLRSLDGQTWEPVSTPATEDLLDVTWGFAGFVAVGRAGHVVTSSDGYLWTLQAPVPASLPDSLVAVAMGPDRVVAVGGDAFSVIVSSPDGAAWSVELEGAGGRDWLRDVAAGEPGFVASGGMVAGETVPRTSVSPDSRSWSGRSVPGEGTGVAVAWGQQRWLLVRSDGAVVSSGTCFERWVQVVAGLPGAFGSQWQTDLTIRNPGEVPAHVELTLHRSPPVTTTTIVDPGAQAVFEDLVGAGFGVDGKATLEIRSDARVVVVSRLTNVAADGTFGQWMPGVGVADAVTRDRPVQLLHLRQREGLYRTNLTYANLGEQTATDAVELFSTDGARLDRHEVTVEPGELVQELEPFTTLAGQPDLGWGFAVVAVEGSAEGIVVTASVIDSRTNDATTVLPEPL
jgi:hypothetical protein